MNISFLTPIICHKVDTLSSDLLQYLESCVNQDSGSSDTDDVNAFGDFLIRKCESMGGVVTREKSTIAGDPIAVTFNCDPESDIKRVLFVCHRDTVFPHGTTTHRPFTQDAEMGYGPGCADMKGGITVGIHAIKILQELKNTIAPIPLEIIFSSDEEIGSAASADFIAQRAKNAKVAFFLEPARPQGQVVTARDGGDLIEIEVKGVTAHAGNRFEDGRSAIHALGQFIAECAKLSNAQEGYSTNVGKIEGGEGAIIVAEHAKAEIYTRFSTLQQREFLLGRIQQLTSELSRDGIKISTVHKAGFLPFLPNEENQKLYKLVCQAGATMNLEVPCINVRGAADAGITSCAGVPTICGMGVVGGNLHIPSEFMVKASLVERTKLLAIATIMANETYD